MRQVDFAGKPHRAIAVRDLRARNSAEQHIRFLAHHNSLTGLPNRSSFNKKLDQEIELAMSSGRKLAVLCLDHRPLQGGQRPVWSCGGRQDASIRRRADRQRARRAIR